MKEKKSPLNTTLATQHPMGLAATRLTTLQSYLVVVEKRLEMNTLYIRFTKKRNNHCSIQTCCCCAAQSKPMYATI